MKKLSVHDMALIALFAALIAVFSQLVIPMPSGVPLTLQTFIIALCGFFLGKFKSAAAVAVYIAIGAVGVPVFSSLKGGLGVLFGVTGGFIFGFIPMVFLCGLKHKKLVNALMWGFLGVLACHFFGVLWLAAYTTDIRTAFLSASLPYLPKDFVSTALAYIVSQKLRQHRAISG